VLAHLGGLLAMQGDFDAAHRFYDESVALHDELGLRFRRAVVGLVGAEIATLEGDAAGAERQLRAGSDALEAIGASGARAALVSVLADLVCSEGRDDEALALADLTEQVAEEGDVLPHTLRLAVVGRVQARGGSVQEGLDAVRAAVGTASATDFPWLQAATLVALGEVEGLAGDAAAARQAYDAARATHEDKGNLVAAERIARSLALAT
jgi:ATP/maltotriose-dependent transcriptional regulator MalT